MFCIDFNYSYVFSTFLSLVLYYSWLPTHNASAGTKMAPSRRYVPGKGSRPSFIYSVPLASCSSL